MARFLAVFLAVLASPVFAQDAEPIDFNSESRVTANGYQAAEGDKLVSHIYGANVYASTATDAPIIGAISDIVINDTGDITAMVVGVGGFLRIGEKAIALDYADLRWVVAKDGSWRWILPATTSALLGAPSFTWTDQPPAPTGGVLPQGLGNDTLSTDAGIPVERVSFTAGLLTAGQLIGAQVFGAGRQQVGTIKDIVLGGDAQGVDAVVVEVGGFLGMGARQVAIAVESLGIPANAATSRIYTVNATAEMLLAQPAFDRDAYVRQRETQRLVLAR